MCLLVLFDLNVHVHSLFDAFFRGLREKSKRAIFNGSKIGKKYRKKRVKVAENSDKESIFLFLRIAAKKRLFYLRIAA